MVKGFVFFRSKMQCDYFEYETKIGPILLNSGKKTISMFTWWLVEVESPWNLDIFANSLQVNLWYRTESELLIDLYSWLESDPIKANRLVANVFLDRTDSLTNKSKALHQPIVIATIMRNRKYLPKLKKRKKKPKITLSIWK